jgi:ABC-type branched-subunit amino acid transport system permease subunit
MSYALAYSVLTPITGGETGLQIKIDRPADPGQPLPRANPARQPLRHQMRENESRDRRLALHLQRRLLCRRLVMLIAFYIAIRIFRSPFGMMLRAVKSNQQRMNYTGLNSGPTRSRPS